MSHRLQTKRVTAWGFQCGGGHDVGASGGCCRDRLRGEARGALRCERPKSPAVPGPRLGRDVGLPLLLLLCHVKPDLRARQWRPVGSPLPLANSRLLDRRRDRRGQDGLDSSSAEPVLKHWLKHAGLFWRPRCAKHDRRRQSNNIRRHRQRDIGRSGRRWRSRCQGSCRRDRV